MKSMTGFGRGIGSLEDGTQVTVEISAVNSKKQAEIRISLPKELYALDPELRAQITKSLTRGTLNVSVTYKLSSAALVERVPIDEEMARAVCERLRRFALANGLMPPTIHDVLMVPGVIQLSDTTTFVLKPLVLEALATALKELDATRVKEGAALKEDLLQHANKMEELTDKIIASEHDSLVRYRDKLAERIAKLAVEVPVDEERIAREVAFFADKSDINEETVRLKSHLAQFKGFLDTESDVGRNLDFLCQEMTRETSTLDAKTTDMQLGDMALMLKIELSKIKEQVLNVE